MNRFCTLLVVFVVISCGNKNKSSSIFVSYPNGAKMISTDTINGEINGVLKYYYANGSVKSVQKYLTAIVININY